MTWPASKLNSPGGGTDSSSWTGGLWCQITSFDWGTGCARNRIPTVVTLPGLNKRQILKERVVFSEQ